MALSTDELNGIVAQWEEWTADKGFRLSLAVKEAEGVIAIAGPDAAYGLSALLSSKLYIEVAIWDLALDRLVFCERVPYDAAMLRASVTVLARTIAGWSGEADAEQQPGRDEPALGP